MAAALPENLTREQYVYLAKLAEQAEHYEEMVKFMEKLVVKSTSPGVFELTVEERNLLLVAYKNMIGSLRVAWRIVLSIEQKEEGRKNDEHVMLVKDYRSKVEAELSTVCAGILGILDSHLIPSALSGESKVFYLKMKRDYHRYLVEFKVGDERKSVAEDTMLAYKVAQDIALVDLAPMHPIRLGLALNFLVFYYEILNSSEKACGMVKQVSYVPIEPYLVSKITNMVTHLLATKLYSEFIKIPFSRRRIIEMTQAFEELTSLPNMCGAIDGSPIKLHRLPNDQNLTRNYKCKYGYPSVLLQVVADHKKILWDICVKAPGGTNNATHFRDSLLHNRLASGNIVWEKVINGMGMPT